MIDNEILYLCFINQLASIGNISGLRYYTQTRGTSILGEVRNVEISGVTQQLLCSKSHDFLAVFALAHSKINQIASFFDEIIQEGSD